MKYKKSINCKNPKGFSQNQYYIPVNIINGMPMAFMVYNVTGKLVEQYKMFHFNCSTV